MIWSPGTLLNLDDDDDDDYYYFTAIGCSPSGSRPYSEQ
jgi:hypothetical protein